MLNQTEELLCFAAVCDTGTMTAAGKVLGRSKAHISRQITNFEQRIGNTLLHRSTRKLTLTDAGLRLKEDALQLYKNTQLINHRALSLNDSISGSFVITAPASIATFLLAPIMNQLQKTFPKVNFELRPTNESLDLLDEGIDLAIRTGDVIDENLIAHQIGLAQDVFFIPKDWAKTNPITHISDTLEYKLLIHPYSLSNGAIKLSKENESIELAHHQISKVSDYPLLLNLVGRGVGIGLAPDYCMYALDNLHSVLPEYKGQKWSIMIAYPFQTPLPVKLAEIAKYLKDKLSKTLHNKKRLA